MAPSAISACRTITIIATPSGQALAWRLLFPIWTHVDLIAWAAALGADNTTAEPRHLGLSRIVRHIDQRGVAAGIVEAVRDQVPHVQLAHIAERHYGTGRLLGLRVPFP